MKCPKLTVKPFKDDVAARLRCDAELIHWLTAVFHDYILANQQLSQTVILNIHRFSHIILILQENH